MENLLTNNKRLMAIIYLKDGEAIRSLNDSTVLGHAEEIARIYNDSGVDKILFWDLSTTEEGHNSTIRIIKQINRILEISSYAYGWTNRFKDVQQYLYAGCRRVVLNSSDSNISNLIEECLKRFRKDRLSLAVDNLDVVFKKRRQINECFHDLYIFKADILDSVVSVTDTPFYAFVDSKDKEAYEAILRHENSLGVCGPLIDDFSTDIMTFKRELYEDGIPTILNDSRMEWSEFRLDADGLIAVVAQDYSTKEVLNYGYMNEEAFKLTMAKGKMHYFDKESKTVKMHGIDNEMFQYVKLLAVDCHKQAILAKVSQIGVACHTGNYSCFYTEIMKKDFAEKNTYKVLENTYNVIVNRKKYPREGSFTSFLQEKGLNEILRRITNETTSLVISSKDDDEEELRTEISDLIYYLMVLMSEYELTWDDVINELIQRK